MTHVSGVNLREACHALMTGGQSDLPPLRFRLRTGVARKVLYFGKPHVELLHRAAGIGAYSRSAELLGVVDLLSLVSLKEEGRG